MRILTINIILTKSRHRCMMAQKDREFQSYFTQYRQTLTLCACMHANRHNQTRNNLKIVLRTHARSMMIEYAICSKRPTSSAARVRCWNEAALRLERFVVVFILFHFVPLCRSHSWFHYIRDPKTHVYERS